MSLIPPGFLIHEESGRLLRKPPEVKTEYMYKRIQNCQ